MYSTDKFEKIFMQILHEDTSSAALGGSEGGFGPPDNISSSDFYAPGSAIIPKGSKVMQRRIPKRKRKFKRLQSKRKSVNTSL
jgi:hypothetical protein